MRPSLLALAVAVALGIVGCGGNGGGETTKPLTLEQRAPTKTDAPGSKPDPVEKGEAATGVNQFVEKLADRLVAPSTKDLREFRRSGFVAAVSETRFFPASRGAGHTRNAAHLFAVVMQFKADDGAKKAVELLHNDARRPCPEQCADLVEEFDVDGTPDAVGVRRYATARRLKAFGEPPGDAHAAYVIDFPDGRFAYHLSLFGAYGKVSERQADQIAQRLYDRVGGAPAPEQ